MKAFGLETAKKLLRHWPYTYCPNMANYFTLNANPKKGDIVVFYRNGEFAHTGIVISVNGDQFTTIEGNTSGGSTIIANGGGVCQKSYYNSNLPGTKFCTPDYSIVTKIVSGGSASTTTATTTTNSGTSSNTMSSANTLWKGTINKDKAPVRTWAGKEYKECSFSPLKKGTSVEVQYSIKDAKGRDWHLVRYGNVQGFVYGKYVDRVKDKTTTAKTTTTTTTTAAKTSTKFRVQCGVYSVEANAKATQASLKKEGITTVIIKVDGQNIVQAGMFDKLDNANAYADEIKAKGFQVAVVAVKV